MVALQVKLVPFSPLVLASGARTIVLVPISVAIGSESSPLINHSSLWTSSPLHVQTMVSEAPDMKGKTPLLVALVVNLPNK